MEDASLDWDPRGQRSHGSGVQEREGQKALDQLQGLFMGSWKPFPVAGVNGVV